MGTCYWVYLLANQGGTLYCGVTNDISRRTSEHKFEHGSQFTTRYEVMKLVWFETYASPQAAIDREKQIKSWRREKKVKLIEAFNPEWDDLYGAL